MWLRAEAIEAQGWVRAPNLKYDFQRLHDAVDAFPLDHFMRSEPAYAALQAMRVLSRDFILSEVNATLKNDPNSTYLLQVRDALVKEIKGGHQVHP